MRYPIRRALSLGLCGTLLAGLLATGVSAADPTLFSDAKDVNHWQAVATLAQLEVISGKDSGAFDPGAPVTRGEAAKLLTVLLNGGKMPEVQVMEAPAFQDIDSHWAKPFILYCASLGVLGGRSEGVFDPDGQVTAAELAKMALVSLGYDPNVYGLTGLDWEISTNRLANEAKLYEGLKNEADALDVSQPIDREKAAQVLWNLLKAPVILRSVDPESPPGEEVYTYSTKDADGRETTFFQCYFSQDSLPEPPAQPK